MLVEIVIICEASSLCSVFLTYILVYISVHLRIAAANAMETLEIDKVNNGRAQGQAENKVSSYCLLYELVTVASTQVKNMQQQSATISPAFPRL